MKAMIFAAGLGTRLRPLTDTLPKALVPVCGKPLLYHVMRKLIASGFDDIVINVHHFAGKIREYLASQDNFGVRVSISDETDMLRETGGGIRHARSLLEPQPFLVHNVDIISDLDLQSFVARCRPDALASLLVSERPSSRRLLFDDRMRLMGWNNLQTGEVRSPYPHLDVESCRSYAFSGIHFVSGGIFSAMDRADEEAASSGVAPFGERFPIMDFYLRVAAEEPVFGVVEKNLHLADVGKMQTIHEAERLFRDILRY